MLINKTLHLFFKQLHELGNPKMNIIPILCFDLVNHLNNNNNINNL